MSRCKHSVLHLFFYLGSFSWLGIKKKSEWKTENKSWGVEIKEPKQRVAWKRFGGGKSGEIWKVGWAAVTTRRVCLCVRTHASAYMCEYDSLSNQKGLLCHSVAGATELNWIEVHRAELHCACIVQHTHTHTTTNTHLVSRQWLRWRSSLSLTNSVCCVN